MGKFGESQTQFQRCRATVKVSYRIENLLQRDSNELKSEHQLFLASKECLRSTDLGYKMSLNKVFYSENFL